MAKIIRKGYGQLEINKAAFRRDGRVEAQTPYDTSVEGKKYENGMVAIIRQGAKVETGVIKEGDLYGIIYTSEELYDNSGLKNFGVEVVNGEAKGPKGYDVLPRLGYLSVGDTFTLNTVDATQEYDDSLALTINEKGEWTTAEAPEGYAGPIAKVVKVSNADHWTMPDGQDALQIVITKA